MHYINGLFSNYVARSFNSNKPIPIAKNRTEKTFQHAMALQFLLASLLPLAHALPQGGGMAGSLPKFVSTNQALFTNSPVTTNTLTI